MSPAPSSTKGKPQDEKKNFFSFTEFSQTFVSSADIRSFGFIIMKNFIGGVKKITLSF